MNSRVVFRPSLLERRGHAHVYVVCNDLYVESLREYRRTRADVELRLSERYCNARHIQCLISLSADTLQGSELAWKPQPVLLEQGHKARATLLIPILVPVYQSELCDANKRGKLISSEVFFIGVGIVIAYFFDYGMFHLGGGVAWRVPIACQNVFALVSIYVQYPLCSGLMKTRSLYFWFSASRKVPVGFIIMTATTMHAKSFVMCGTVSSAVRGSTPRKDIFFASYRSRKKQRRGLMDSALQERRNPNPSPSASSLKHAIHEPGVRYQSHCVSSQTITFAIRAGSNNLTGISCHPHSNTTSACRTCRSCSLGR